MGAGSDAVPSLLSGEVRSLPGEPWIISSCFILPLISSWFHLEPGTRVLITLVSCGARLPNSYLHTASGIYYSFYPVTHNSWLNFRNPRWNINGLFFPSAFALKITHSGGSMVVRRADSKVKSSGFKSHPHILLVMWLWTNELYLSFLVCKMGVTSAMNSYVRWRSLHENVYKAISMAPGPWEYISIIMNYVIDDSFQSLYCVPMQPRALLGCHSGSQRSEVPPTPLLQLLGKMA